MYTKGNCCQERRTFIGGRRENVYASKAETVVRTCQCFKENDSLRVGVVSNLWSDRCYENVV